MQPSDAWLTRFAPTRWSQALAWTLLWLVVNLAPLWAVEGLAEDLWFWRTDATAGLLDLSRLYALLPFALVCELYAVACGFGLLKGRLLAARGQSARGRRAAWTTASVLAVCAVGFFALCVMLSWALHGRAGSFLGIESVRLFAFAADASNLVSIATAADLLLLGGAAAAALGVAALLFVLAPPAADWRGALMPGAVALWMFAVVFYLFHELVAATPPASLSRLRVSAHHAISPRMSLLWAPLFLGREESFEVVPLALEPYRDVDAWAAAVERAPRPRDVLLVVVEALRADALAAAGGDPRIVPTLDRLEREGVLFSNARAQSSETDASWVAILTGLYPLRFPYRDLRRDADYPYTRIYDLLSAAGYRTALVTHEWDITRRVTSSGRLDLHFDPLTEPPGSLAERFPEITGGRELTLDDIHALDRINVEQLDRWVRADPQRPWFAALYLESTHFPYPQDGLAERPFAPFALEAAPSFLDYPAELADVMRNRYWNTLRGVDAMLAELIESLRRQGRLERTIIIVTGDHGQSFHEHGEVTHGRYLYEEAIRVPIVVWGAGDRAPRDPARPAAHVDIAPTILDLLGLPPRGSFQGESLFAADPDGGPRGGCRPIFSSVQLVTFEDAVVCGRWKFAQNHWGRGERLFDLAADPGERRDLIQQRPALARRLRALLDAFRNAQLTYHRLSDRRRLTHFPPRYERVQLR